MDAMTASGWEFLPDRAIWWPSESTLIVSDLHLGKAAHFRRHGIAVPNAVNTNTLERLSALVSRHRPQRLLVLGDLFHSEENSEWLEFKAWLSDLNAEPWFEEFRLVEGNHDILHPSAFDGVRLERSARWVHGNWMFVHDPDDVADLPDGRYGVSGHLHPALSLVGKGRQSLKLPCWWYSAERRVLVVPTFGTFTGSVSVKPQPGDSCWVTTGDTVISVPVSA
ncbi:MAG: metallophosphoesterase [Crocinitomicaceae bacterium]|nr:metallophosphoesterase [Crocinitomicaceae bacterium]